MDHSSHSNSDSDNEIMDHSGQSDSDSDKEKKLRWAAAHAAASIVAAYSVMFEDSDDDDTDDKQTFRLPKELRDMYRTGLFYRLFFDRRINSYEFLRMDRGPFLHLARMLRNEGYLKDTIHVSVEEQLAMFLNTVGHNETNRDISFKFVRSGETVSRYFNLVLVAIMKLRPQLLQQAGNEEYEEIRSRPTWYPWFKDCIGFIDGTHIQAKVNDDIVARFHGRKGPTQNVLAAITPNKLFCYVMSGWEGSANDFTVLKSALSLPPPRGLRVIRDKYYLCDAGYTTMPGFIAPFRGVRYHLKEQEGRVPQNHRELFNLRHSSLRSGIESSFGILKKRFKILTSAPEHPYPTQTKVVIACCILHNYIMLVHPDDKFIREDGIFDDTSGDVLNEEIEICIDNMSRREEREAKEAWVAKRDQIARAMWVDYCVKYRHGDETETGLG